ncbi:CLUMA_CG017155, isoform A [Clunio marinus]|uniref:CLUMA_CG017155, isoform A n=1 Tax=Clunio marinus TaxID=568069 RepID=A0A1J1IV36_9DIPT|nr:CLUMA_CG017155, isoform A [Clunio marinus]
MLRVLILIFLFCLHVFAKRIPVIHDGNDDSHIPHLKYIASLQLANREEDFFCAGVFISSKTVLTLASCFYQNDVLLNPEEVKIVAGRGFRFEYDQNPFNGILEEIILHENFSRSSLENNIAVGILSADVPSNKNVEVLDIEDIASEAPNEGDKCEIFGWSLTTLFGSQHLLSGEVQIEAKDKCDNSGHKLTSATICAGPYYVNGCPTDDGSPLVCNKKLHGLIDIRPVGYCSMIITNRLGTYVDLSVYREWIYEHANGNSASILSSRIFLCLIAVFIAIFS